MRFARFQRLLMPWFSVSTVSLVALLQRMPVMRLAAVAEGCVLRSPLGVVLKSTAALGAALGAVHSLAGATRLAVSPAVSPLAATAGTAIADEVLTVTGAESSPGSFTISGAIPPGLSLAGSTTISSATALPKIVNGSSLTLSGTPTTAGTYNIGIKGWEKANGQGKSSSVFTFQVVVTGAAAVAPACTTHPHTQSTAAGGNLVLTCAGTGTPTPTHQWQCNGTDVAGATTSSLTLANVQPATTGLYRMVLTNSAGSAMSEVAIVGVTSDVKVIGTGEVVGSDVPHPNGNIFDQVLVNGAAESVTADFAVNQVTRTSYIDLDNDIVQVEFSGPGTLSLVLANNEPAAPPVNYNQPTVNYVKGHAGIVITGADERTNVSVFTVGRATAFDRTGTYNILLAPSATNVPANNGSPLFEGHGVTNYDGIADIAFIAISTTNGKFGGIRTSNANYFAAKGLTGVYAPGVAFQGPVFVGDIIASDAATPVLIVGSAADVRVTGGDMLQANGQAVQVSGITQLKFTPGGDSHGGALSAQANQGVFMQGGTNVTSQIVVNP